MQAEQRREEIKLLLEQAQSAISASNLAKRFHISRQVIVGDIALLRASGCAIDATPRGYVLHNESNGFSRLIACRHDFSKFADELYTFVDNGATVLNVIVEHPLYGQLVGNLNLSNRYEVDCFIKNCKNMQAAPLSLLTDGIHLHTVNFPDQAAYERCVKELRAKQILWE